MDWIQSLKNTETIRQELMNIREQFNDEYRQDIIQNKEYFIQLLHHEDSKTRKIVADLLSKTECIDFKQPLLDLYFTETQHMICPSLLKSLSRYDLTDEMEQLSLREELLINAQNSDWGKHAKEELRVIRKILQNYRTLPKHQFIGFEKPVPIILTIPAGHQEALIDELVGMEAKKVSLGVQIKTNDMTTILENRLFSTMYFPLCKIPSIDLDNSSSQEVASKVVKFLNKCHQGSGAYRFRLDYEDVNKSRTIAELLEAQSNGELQNYPSDYEIEIRIRANQKNEGVVYLKLMTIPDERFAYRQQASSSALASHTAALIAHYLQDYVKADGQLLDPMCNDGTLLIERCLAMPPHFVMGLDYSAEVMNKAKQNANNAHVDIRFVQRELKTFTHQRKFNEILCQLPSIRKKDEQTRIENLYLMVFRKVKELMEVGGIFSVYTQETALVKQVYNKNRSFLQLRKQIPIMGKRVLYIFEVLDTYTR